MDDVKIFISHRSTDEAFAGMLVAFLCKCGVPSSQIFCSSIPGNDVKHTIAKEIKEALLTSKLNIVLLSKKYYFSPFCQNEAGVIWFLDVDKIVIGLPDIDENSMQGFLDKENIIRRLDSKDDILKIKDIAAGQCEELRSLASAKLNYDTDKLICEYKDALYKYKDSVKAKSLIPMSGGMYTANIVEKFTNSKGTFYKLDGILELDNADVSKDKSHWICDWNSTMHLDEGYTVHFWVVGSQFKDTIYHGNKKLTDVRNIDIEIDAYIDSDGNVFA